METITVIFNALNQSPWNWLYLCVVIGILVFGVSALLNTVSETRPVYLGAVEQPWWSRLLALSLIVFMATAILLFVGHIIPEVHRQWVKVTEQR